MVCPLIGNVSFSSQTGNPATSPAKRREGGGSSWLRRAGLRRALSETCKSVICQTRYLTTFPSSTKVPVKNRQPWLKKISLCLASLSSSRRGQNLHGSWVSKFGQHSEAKRIMVLDPALL